MSPDVVVALLWGAANLVGIIISGRAVVRGIRRYRASVRSRDPVARAVNGAEVAAGVLGLAAFGVSAATAVVSVLLLPVGGGEPTTEQLARASTLRLMLFVEKAFYIALVLVPEVLDRRLMRLAAERDHGHASDIPKDSS